MYKSVALSVWMALTGSIAVQAQTGAGNESASGAGVESGAAAERMRKDMLAEYREPLKERWQKDCDALVQLLADLAPRASDADGERFRDKRVLWELTFRRVAINDKGEASIQFDLDAFGIRKKFFSGRPVMLNFKSAAGATSAWSALLPGAPVMISAVVTRVSFMTVTSGDNPGMRVPVAGVWLENVRAIADNPGK